MALRCTRQSIQVLAGGVGTARVERQMLEALAEGNGLLRVSRQSAQVLAAGIGKARVERQMLEALVAGNGPLRVSRQSVQVLAAGSGKARVERQMVEVLAEESAGGNVYEESLTSALSLASAVHCSVCQVDAGNSLSLTSAATSAIVKNREAENTIVLTQELGLRLEAQSAITIVDTVAITKVQNRITTSATTLSQLAGYDLVCHRFTASPLTLAQEAIYHGPITVSAANPLALTGTAYRCQTFLASAQSSLTLVQVNDVRGTIRVSALNALSILSLADRGTFNRAAANELVLSQSASPDYRYTAVSTLELTSTAIQGQIFASAASTLALTQIARPNPLTAGPGPEYDFLLPPTAISLQQHVKINIHMLTAESTLILTDALGVKRPWYLDAESEVQTTTELFDPATRTLVDVIAGLSDAAVATKKMVTPFASRHYLQLTDQTNVVRIKAGSISASAENVLSLHCDLYINRTGLAVNHLNLWVCAHADLCVPINSVVEVSDAALGNIIRLRTAESPLGLIQSLSAILCEETNAVLYNYQPFIGEGAAGAPAPPPAVLDGPLPGVTVSFQLFYPATGAITDSITLRTPNLGNKDRLSFNRVLRETRGGTLIVHADPIWPKIQTIVLSFSGLKANEKDDLLNFLDTHLGLEIGLLDWEHRYWRGVIVTPDDPVVQDDRNSFSVSFEFEGELDPTWSPPP